MYFNGKCVSWEQLDNNITFTIRKKNTLVNKIIKPQTDLILEARFQKLLKVQL